MRGVEQDGQPGSALARGIALFAQGRYQSALDQAVEACRIDVDFPEAHYLCGQSYAALGQQSDAEQSFEQAVRLKPNWADAWVNYGLARYAQGQIEPAKIAMRQALRAQPGHKAATANLGALLRVTGQPDASEAILRAALRVDPDNAAARLNLVADLMGEERHAEALALLDGSPPRDLHASRHWHLQRALALAGIGRVGDARAALDAFDSFGPSPPELLPLRLWRLIVIALADGHRGSAQAEACAMEAALAAMGHAAVLEHRIMAHYDLAKFWSGFDAYARAFSHWKAGHDLLKAVQPFSREAAKVFTDATAATFTAERFATGPRATNGDTTPVFIVGMPRSGTTLCEQILAAHHLVYGAGERTALGQLFYQLAGDESVDAVARIASLSSKGLDDAASAYLTEMHELAPTAHRIVDKMPSNYRYIWLIALLFPNAKIIHCTRDPRDIGLSIFTFRFHGDHGYAHDLGDLGWTIVEHERSMAHWKALFPNQVLTVRLQDWIEDFDGSLARVLCHVDLPPDSNCKRFHEAEGRVRTMSRAQVRQPINARGLGRWRTYAQSLSPLIEELERGGVLAKWQET